MPLMGQISRDFPIATKSREGEWKLASWIYDLHEWILVLALRNFRSLFHYEFSASLVIINWQLIIPFALNVNVRLGSSFIRQIFLIFRRCFISYLNMMIIDNNYYIIWLLWFYIFIKYESLTYVFISLYKVWHINVKVHYLLINNKINWPFGNEKENQINIANDH